MVRPPSANSSCISGEQRSVATPMQAGSTPKATTSARESTCTPNLHSRSQRSFLVRATLPSKASHRPLASSAKIPM